MVHLTKIEEGSMCSKVSLVGSPTRTKFMGGSEYIHMCTKYKGPSHRGGLINEVATEQTYTYMLTC